MFPGDGTKALILAGGFAKRLGTIGELMPKAMIIEKGDTILNHLVNKIRAVNLEPIISTNKKFEKFFSGYQNVIVEDAMAEEQKLGAVSAIWNAIEKMKIEEDLMVVCADNYFSSSFEGFVSSYTGEPLVGIYYVGRNPEMKPEEMATVKFNGSENYPPPASSFFFTDFKEKVTPPLSSYVSTGAYIFPKRVFPVLREFCRSAKQDAPGFFIQHLMQRGERVRGYLFGGEWYDVSHKSYLQAFREARVVKNDDRYIVCDRPLGGNLVLSITILHAGKQTTGHSHPVGEVYFFIEGEGELETNGNRRRVREKDVATIAPNEFHRVYNTRDKDLVFISVFEKYGERG
ncbi:MAG: sugar phosphate nucleotidyltransferase [Candidatus Hadarchaeum sp.]|uniref:sugar phosphate nucleotidyltransferase n=1 Tax=Candidatus Hadarchaeum sp. TaxID=2883567 RepID=UPI003D0D7E85